MSEKSPFISYTLEQIFAYEAITYVIIAGIDFFNIDGNYFFSKSKAVRNYNKLARQLSNKILTGTKKERRSAKMILENLRIEQMRIH